MRRAWIALERQWRLLRGVTLWESCVGGLRDSLETCSVDLSEINEFGEKWSG